MVSPLTNTVGTMATFIKTVGCSLSQLNKSGLATIIWKHHNGIITLTIIKLTPEILHRLPEMEDVQLFQRRQPGKLQFFHSALRAATRLQRILSAVLHRRQQSWGRQPLLLRSQTLPSIAVRTSVEPMCGDDPFPCCSVVTVKQLIINDFHNFHYLLTYLLIIYS